MKKILFLVLLLPALAIAQSDFETQGFRLDAVPSTEIKGLELIPYQPFGSKQTFGNISVSIRQLAPLTFSTNEYWQPVDMYSAANRDNNFIDSKPTEDSPFASQLNNQFAQPGLNGANRFKVYANDEYSRVNNSVFEDQRMPYYGNPYYYNPYYRQSSLTLYKNKGNKSTISIQVREY